MEGRKIHFRRKEHRSGGEEAVGDTVEAQGKTKNRRPFFFLVLLLLSVFIFILFCFVESNITNMETGERGNGGTESFTVSRGQSADYNWTSVTLWCAVKFMFSE